VNAIISKRSSVLQPILVCVANFSEGRDTQVLARIAAVIEKEPGVRLLHQTADHDHHRSVFTFAGSPDAVVNAAIAAIGAASEHIDLRSHQGQHPRIGAADVVPFVPIRSITLDEAAQLAVEAGTRVWQEFSIPVYLYEAAARTPERRKLEHIRRGNFEQLVVDAPITPERAPDIGGPSLHPSAGAVVIGARKPLIAYNVNLANDDLQAARTIARTIRASSGGFPHVKALGLLLENRRQAQVSMNLTDYEQTPLHVVYEAVRSQAEALGAGPVTSELIGLVPRGAIEQAASHYLNFEHFDSGSILENRIDEAFASDPDWQRDLSLVLDRALQLAPSTPPIGDELRHKLETLLAMLRRP
jgi:glutamate formiminotransferase